MPRILAFLTIIGIAFFSSSFSGGSIGVSSECFNDDCKVIASSSLTSLFLSIILAAFIFLFPRKKLIIDSSKDVGLWRRFAAFMLDFISVLIVITPILVVPFLMAEASYTGEFIWSFERDFARDSDNLYILPSVFSLFLALYFYFFLYARSKKQTVGQYVMNYMVMALENSELKPQYARRILFSFLGLSMWPISVILALRSPNKTCWWDSATNTRVVKMDSGNKALDASAGI